MNYTRILAHLIPYLASLGISSWVAIFVWRRKEVKGARAYAWVAISMALWTFGYIFELTSISLRWKIFWDDFQWLGALGWYLSLLAFAFDFTDTKFKRPKQTWVLLSVFPAVLVVLLLTNSFHGLMHKNETLIPGDPFAVLDYEFTFIVYAFAIYGYFLILSGLFLLVRNFYRSKPIYRAQIGIVIISTLIPLVGTMLTLTGVQLLSQRDYTPITFAISNLIAVIGLFRHQLLNVSPVAYRTVFENISDAIIALDTRNRVIDFNDAAKKLLPQLSSESIGILADEIFQDMPNAVEKLKERNEVQTELAIIAERGITYQDLRISPLHDRTGRFIGRVMVIRDITEEKIIAQEADKYAMQLEASNQELEAFAYSVSHDLRAPLRAIKGFSQILSNDFGKTLTPEGQLYLGKILSASEEMETLIQDMLRLSRVTRMDINRQEVDLSSLVEKIIEDLKSTDPSRNVVAKIEPGLVADCDIGLMQILFENILGNAWKFTNKNQVTEIVFGKKEIDGTATYFVQDNGVGFEMKYADKIFAPFQRLHQSDEFEGTGIGLATVQRIVRRHGGQVWIEGKQNQGATVYFQI